MGHEQRTPPRGLGPDIDLRVCDAARAVFARRGYASATMEAIAVAAGVTKPTIYARYASKEDLHRAVIEADGQRLVDHLLRASMGVGSASFDEAVRASVRAYFAFFEANPDTFGLLFSAARSGEAGHVADEVTEQVTRMVSSVALALADRHGVVLSTADARLTAAIMLGAAKGAVGLALRDRDITLERAERITLEVLTRGLQSPG